MGDIVENLRSMAVEMGNEIDHQNQQLDRLDAKVPPCRFFLHGDNPVVVFAA